MEKEEAGRFQNARDAVFVDFKMQETGLREMHWGLNAQEMENRLTSVTAS